MPSPRPSVDAGSTGEVWQNNYHRPNSPWVCGRMAIGEPCWTGPTAQGDCGCRADCHPSPSHGTWTCTRPKHRGGPCATGPGTDGQCGYQRTPCVPVRSWRAQRDRLSLALGCIGVGIAMLVIGSGQTYNVIAPGPLSSPHAERLAHHGSDRCASCHPQAHGRIDQWISSWVSRPPSDSRSTQSELCLNCHQRDLCHEYALVAHNVPPTDLAARTAEVAQSAGTTRTSGLRQVAQSLFEKRPTAGQKLACATCHREHHGQQVDMKAMTDQQCQACHGQVFHRFELDHPEFRNWPQVPDAGIRFNHQSHHFQYFPQADRPFECSQCHRDDRAGNVQQLVAFEQACGTCHQGTIELSSHPGIALLQLPSLDLAALTAAHQDVGQWPTELSADFDGRLSPLSELLLVADQDAAAGLVTLGHQFDFLDLDPTNPEHLTAAAQIAWGLKRLLADLASRGGESLRERLQIVLGRPIDDARLRRLTQNFSPTFAQDSIQAWFPQLWQEMAWKPNDSQSGRRSSDDLDNLPSFGTLPFRSVAVPQRMTVPPEVLARLLTAPSQEPSHSEWLIENPLAKRYATPATQPPATDRHDQSPNASGGLRPVEPTQEPPRVADQRASHSDLLAENPLANYGRPASDRQVKETSLDGTSPGVGTDKQSGAPALPWPDSATEIQAQPPLAGAPGRGPAAGLVRPVGWVRHDSQHTLRYHWQGHADPWLTEWLDLMLGDSNAGASHRIVADVATTLAAPDQAGNCLQCHGGDRSGWDGSMTAHSSVRWTASYRDPNLKGWTKFNHRPHTLLPSLGDCRTCHQLRERGVELSDRAPHALGSEFLGPRSDFHPLTRAQCASCHQAGGTSNRCTTCHNYHIGQRLGP